MSKRAIAFFDVDKTLLAANTARLWMAREHRLGFVTRWDVMRAGAWLLLYEMGMADISDVLRQAVKSIAGVEEKPIIDRTLAFWHESVFALFRERARSVVEEHRARGDLLFLLTSSSNYLSAPIADELRMDGFCANRMVVERGRFVGSFEEPICYGAGKISHAQSVCSKLGIELRDCTFYTDSYSDLPALLAVGTPVAVNPDRRLHRYARRKGWRIEDWGGAEATPRKSITQRLTPERYEELKARPPRQLPGAPPQVEP
jgi:HAD superfamily hydrolase (TIGR01490 family)